MSQTPVSLKSGQHADGAAWRHDTEDAALDAAIAEQQDQELPLGLLLAILSVAYQCGFITSGSYMTEETEKILLEHKDHTRLACTILEENFITDKPKTHEKVGWQLISGAVAKSTSKAASLAHNITKRGLALQMGDAMKHDLVSKCTDGSGEYIPKLKDIPPVEADGTSPTQRLDVRDDADDDLDQFGGGDGSSSESDEDLDEGENNYKAFNMLHEVQEFFANPPPQFCPRALVASISFLEKHPEYLSEELWYDKPNSENEEYRPLSVKEIMEKTGDCPVGKKNILLIPKACFTEAISAQRANIAILMQKCGKTRSSLNFDGPELRRSAAREKVAEGERQKRQNATVQTAINAIVPIEGKERKGALHALGQFIRFVCKEAAPPAGFMTANGYVDLRNANTLKVWGRKKATPKAKFLKSGVQASDFYGPSLGYRDNACKILMKLGLGTWSMSSNGSSSSSSSSSATTFKPSPNLILNEGNADEWTKAQENFTALIRILVDTPDFNKENFKRMGKGNNCIHYNAAFREPASFARFGERLQAVRAPATSTPRSKSRSQKKDQKNKRDRNRRRTPGRAVTPRVEPAKKLDMKKTPVQQKQGNLQGEFMKAMGEAATRTADSDDDGTAGGGGNDCDEDGMQNAGMAGGGGNDCVEDGEEFEDELMAVTELAERRHNEKEKK